LFARVENGNVMMEVEEEEQTGRGCPDEWDDVSLKFKNSKNNVILLPQGKR
jgi:hypothetical protein